MWELDHKEGCALKNWCFQNEVLEKILENPLLGKEIKPVNPKGNQPWIFIGKADTEAEAPILWPCDMKSCLIGKGSNPGKDWGQEEKGVTKNEMVGWHHKLNGREFEQTLGYGEGQGGLLRWSLWGHKELGTTEQLNNNRKKQLMEVENSYSDIQREALSQIWYLLAICFGATFLSFSLLVYKR